jgi:hypothetical protein
MHARVRRHHIHTQAERRFEEALVPFERNVAGPQRIAVGVEQARQKIFVVVEEAAEAEAGGPG